ncbi:MAG: chemotaxis protein CheB [Thiohalobacteraceae bacterium]
MADAASRNLRVALIADQEPQGTSLKALLESNGLEVIVQRNIREYDPGCVSAEQADVLLVDLDERAGHEMERLEALIERSAIPILFNEGGIPGGSGWGRKLIAKLSGLVSVHRAPPMMSASGMAQVTEAEAARNDSSAFIETESDTPRAAAQRPALRVVGPDQEASAPPRQVWVLAASLGGPQALKSFVAHLPGDLPIAFVVAQHIGRPFVPLLAEQLGRVAKVSVRPAETGRALRTGEVVLVPVDRRFRLADGGMVELRDEPMRGPYKPCIDEVMEEVVAHYGAATGAIVFSGMGEDGATGALAIADAGGLVWAQDADSCVISSMPDAARRCGVVRYSGTPELLAAKLAEQVSAQAHLC